MTTLATDSGERAGCRVVVCDDHPTFRGLIVMLLSAEADMSVVAEASDGHEAVAAARLHKPDMMLLDVAMPGMDGLEALPLVLAASPDTSVMMFTGFSNKDFKRRADELGASGYFEKGIAPAELIAAMREACA